MTWDIEIKTSEILQLTKENEMIESESHEEITKCINENEQLVMEQKEVITKQIHAKEQLEEDITRLILEKEQLEEDQKKVVMKLSSDREAEVSKLHQAVLLVQEQLEGREEVCRDLERKVKEGQGRVEQKENE